MSGADREPEETIEQIQQEIARTRHALAQTVEELSAKLDVGAQARGYLHRVRDVALDVEGRPRVGVLIAVIGAAGIVLLVVSRGSRR